jgi:hypothetical protein
MERKRIKTVLLALFICYGAGVQAQTETEGKRYIDNDNWWYFQDIALEHGAYVSTISDHSMSDASITSLYGSYFLTHNAGFRSGISLIVDESHYLKIPFLFALRTGTLRLSAGKSENLGEFLKSLIFLIIPARGEINIGPSLGYAWNARRNFASSIDANLRLGFQIWRIGINGNMGINYLWTNNFAGKKPHGRKSIDPVWFVNLSAGLSFRF